MRRRMLLTSTMAMGALFLVATPVFSAPDVGVVDRFVDTEYRVQGDQTVAIETVVSQKDGRVLSKSTTTSKNPEFRAQNGLPFACAHEGHREGFRERPRREVLNRGKNDFIHFQFFPYSMEFARDKPGGGPSQQWLVCATGGADANNGSRMTLSGPGMAYKDAGQTYKMGQVWKEGRTPANYTVSLGFEVGGPNVKVNGGIQQTPSNSLKGSVRPPFDSDMDAFSRNGVHGWWEHACVPRCGGASGSGDFQGSVAEGLWEFPQNKPVNIDDFAMSGFTRHFCANPFGC